MSSGFGADFQFNQHNDQSGEADGKDKVVCRDGRVFHACEICRKRRSRCDGNKPKCTSCEKRGLNCEYRAMRKRGRHGKRALPFSTGTGLIDVEMTGDGDSWSLGSSASTIGSRPLTASTLGGGSGGSAGIAAMHGDPTMSLLDSFPPFFSIPSDISMADEGSHGRGNSVAMDSIISAMASPPATSSGVGESSRNPLAMQGPADLFISASLRGSAIVERSALTSAFLESINSQQQQQHHRQSVFLGSPSPLLPPPPPPPPMTFRSLSHSSSMFDSQSICTQSPVPSSVGSSLSMVTGMASPIGLGGMMQTTSANSSLGPGQSAFAAHQQPYHQSNTYGFSHNNQHQHRSHNQQQQNPLAPSIQQSMSTSTVKAPEVTVADVAAAAEFQFSPPHLSMVPNTPLGNINMNYSNSINSSNGGNSGSDASAGNNTFSRSEQEVAAALLETHPLQTQTAAHSQATPAAATAGAIGSVPGHGPSSSARMRRNGLGVWTMIDPAGTTDSAAATEGAEGSTGTRRQRSGECSRTIVEEEEVLDGLNADGADNFGRPLFDVTSYPPPAAGELEEHMNGIFEYFYMGVQTLHKPSFRKRATSGLVSPVLIYAIMAVASRYSRRPSLHSLNGMAFLNGDRHASTACGLASIQLNHGDLGTVDTIHGMLFLSVYFMGQGNMLKSRMYLVKAVCTARTMGFQNMDATFLASSPMIAFSGTFDRQHEVKSLLPGACSCPKSVSDLVELETKRRIWWFLVFVDYFTANVMNVPLEIPPDSYCVRLPCSDEEWVSDTLSIGNPDDPIPPYQPYHQQQQQNNQNQGTIAGSSSNNAAAGSLGDFLSQQQQQHPNIPIDIILPRDLGFGDRVSSAQQGAEYLRLNGIHDCHPPWLYHPGAFYLERLMIEFCDHLRRLNNLRALAIRSFFHVNPIFLDESYPYLRRRRQVVSWADRLEKVKASWSWLHLQLNKWLDSILLRFSEVINRVPSDQYNRQYRHQYYYYLIAAHSTIIMSHGVILQLYTDFSRYIRQQQEQELLQQQLYHQQQQQEQMRSQSQTPAYGHSAFSAAMPADPATLLGAANSHIPVSAAAAARPSWLCPGAHTPPVDYSNGCGMLLSEGLSEFAIGTLGSTMPSLMNIAQGLAANGGSSSNGSMQGSSIYGSVMGSPVSGSGMNINGNNGTYNHGGAAAGLDDMLHTGFGSFGNMLPMPGPANNNKGPQSVLNGPNAASSILCDLSDMAMLAWDGCVSTADQLASILRGKHPKFVLLGSLPLEVFREQVLSGDANILSQPGSAFNAPGTGPGADNPILSDPDFYMRLQPSTAWWMFLVAQVQVGHIKRLLKESEGSFKVQAKRKARAAKAATTDPVATGRSDDPLDSTMAPAESMAVNSSQQTPPAAAAAATDAAASASMFVPPGDGSSNMPAMDGNAEQLLGMSQRLQKPANRMQPLSTSMNNSAIMLATAMHMSNAAPAPPTRQAMEDRASLKTKALRLVRAYENLSCMVKVLEGMQQYWQCMDYVSVIQDILKGSERPLH
ncbi:hypothetical protein GGF37_000448 [Kickxella alabastrina]|nr:hypothetical protein GGF37_000448 [Kickxella alabastrina]